MSEERKKCSVCGYYTFTEGKEICPVCGHKREIESSNEEQEESQKIVKMCKHKNRNYIRNQLPSELPWIYEHEAERTGDDCMDMITDQMRVLYYVSNEVHSHEREFYEAATSVFARCMVEKNINESRYCSPNYIEQKEMLHTYELLADYGEYAIESNIKLAQCHLNGFGVSKNMNKVVEYLREAAEYAEIESGKRQENGTD